MAGNSTNAKTPQRLPDDLLEQAAKVLRVLAHPDRMRMVELLLIDRYSVGELAEEVGLSPAATSQHLNQIGSLGVLEINHLGVATGFQRSIQV